jgi:membrane associated rhomboid family serine protease
MGLAERDYERDDPPRGPGFLASLTPVVKALLIANLAIYIIDYLILPSLLDIRVDHWRRPPLVKWGAFTIESAIKEFRIWEFVTFQFLHDSVGHLLFNSLGLFFFGPWVERWWGSAKFLIFYLLCGCGGAAFFSLLATTGILPNSTQTGLIGASAGIYGIFIGVAVLAPDLRVTLIIPPVELSMRQLAIGMLAISVGIIVIGIGDNEGGEAGHLGGAIAGFLLMRYPFLLGKPGDHPLFRRTRRKSKAPKAFTRSSTPKLKPRTHIDTAASSKVDRILDKISRDGVQSLTDAERETLRLASERQSRKP